jgi:porphobilinogen synthase
MRALVREHHLSKDDLIMPLFVKEGLRAPRAISSMPGQFQHTLQSAVRHAKACEDKGIPAVLLFGIPAHHKKNPAGSEAYQDDGYLQKTIRAIKRQSKKLVILADVCLCEYTSHGHCGHLVKGGVDNDLTLDALAKIALSYARAGTDMVAPSDMMDGRVKVIRKTLDKNGFKNTGIMSYAVKYASAFYGPFRDAAENAPTKGDRAGYQMDPPNVSEALREAALDIQEGADMILVKPGVSYLDILYRLKQKFNVPIGIYQVSGEYSMVKAAAKAGWLDEKRVVIETLLSMKRAGANFIITYWALDAAGWLKK